MSRSVSVVLPVYQNAASLAEVVDRVLALDVAPLDAVLRVVLIDDGSTDDSWSVCGDLATRYPDSVSAMRLSRNFGQVKAITAGLDLAPGEAVVVMSADLQDPIDLIQDMIAAWNRGTDIVVAHRKERADGLSARLFSKVAYAVARHGEESMPSGGFDFFLMSRRAVDLFNSYPSQNRFLQGDVLWMGLPTLFIPYQRGIRPHGASTWTFGKKVKYFTDLLLDSTYWPIQFMSRFGFFIASAGILYALVITIAYFMNQTPFPGWAPIMVTLLVIGGILMVMLGIVGEYLWRILDEVKGKPLYIVRDAIGAVSGGDEREPR